MTSRKYGGKLGVTWIDSNLGFSCGSFVSLLKFLELSLSFDLFIVVHIVSYRIVVRTTCEDLGKKASTNVAHDGCLMNNCDSLLPQVNFAQWQCLFLNSGR